MNLLQPIVGLTMNEPTLPPEDRFLRSGGYLLWAYACYLTSSSTADLLNEIITLSQTNHFPHKIIIPFPIT